MPLRKHFEDSFYIPNSHMLQTVCTIYFLEDFKLMYFKEPTSPAIFYNKFQVKKCSMHLFENIITSVGCGLMVVNYSNCLLY